MARKDPNWFSIDDLRKQLSLIDARHLIQRDPPVMQINWQRKTARLETSGDVIVPIIQLDESHITTTRELSDDFPNWRDQLAEAEATRGIDALAWYVSFHNIDQDWGISIPISSLHYVAEKYLNKARHDYTKKLEIAFAALLYHESMHYAVDRNVAAWELILGIPLHGQVPDGLKTHGYIAVEEAIANAHMLIEMNKDHSKSCISALDNWVATSPIGYSEAHDYVDSDMFEIGMDECIKTYTGVRWLMSNSMVGGGLGWINWASQFPIDGPIDLARCPVFIIDDQKGLDIWPTSVKYLKAIPEIIESKKFQKMLNKLPKQIQDTWVRKRESLKKNIPAYPEFEKMKGSFSGIFSIRLGDNYRAHLKPSKTVVIWEAVAIGTHKAMGHG